MDGIVREIWIEGPKRNLSPEAYALYVAELREAAAYYSTAAPAQTKQGTDAVPQAGDTGRLPQRGS